MSESVRGSSDSGLRSLPSRSKRLRMQCITLRRGLALVVGFYDCPSRAVRDGRGKAGVRGSRSTVRGIGDGVNGARSPPPVGARQRIAVWFDDRIGKLAVPERVSAYGEVRVRRLFKAV